jgi:hypothetical protein
VIWPDLSGKTASEDYHALLGRALDAPEGSGRIEELAGPGRSVAIVVDDPSRWTPVREALPLVLGRLLAAGVRPEDISISVGVGRHHAVEDRAMRRRVGDDVASSYRCYSPPVDDLASYEDLGTTAGGIPVRVFRPVAKADLRILIGSVLPHLQAGFGGGYKLIFPGTSHRSTLGALHRQGIGKGSNAARLMGGNASTNPMRLAIHEAAGLLGPCFSISHLIGAPGQILRVAAGHPRSVQDALASEARRRFQAPDNLSAAGGSERSEAGRLADIVVAGNYPWPGDPMQSFKVLLHHRSACRAGGVLVGLFWTDPEEIDRSFPLGAMRMIAASGRPGGWAIRRLVPLAQQVLAAVNAPSAFMLRWARELVVDRAVLVYAPPLYERIGPRLGPVRLFADQDALWRAADEALGLRRSWGSANPANSASSPIVRIFPQGGLTYSVPPGPPR